MIHHQNIKGFTLAELMISVTILALLITFASSIYINFFGSVRNVRAANLIYEEARFAMERIVKEIRNGTVDYEEYYNQSVNFSGIGENSMYGQNYCQYSRQFYSAGPDEFFGTLDDESVGERNTDFGAPLENPLQDELYLINIDGSRRTFIRRFERDGIGRIGLVQLEGRDYGIDHVSYETTDLPPDEGEGDGRIDTWVCLENFNVEGSTCDNGLIAESNFIDITPTSLDIVDLQFILAPTDDPRKAYNDESVQIQPHVTIRLVARANKKLTNEFQSDRTPDITLQSTVSARVYNEIVTECNVRECLPEQTRACPKTLGVCGAPADRPDLESAQQECSQAVWPGCQEEDYTVYADEVYGLDAEFPGGAQTFYENDSEITSCTGSDDADNEACRLRRCSDGFDNDCNGLADTKDLNCLIYLCNNGRLDDGETCLDVGGICNLFRPQVAQEDSDTLCFDNYDNDCSFVVDDPATPGDESEGTGADEFDEKCVNLICTNGQLDPPVEADNTPPYDEAGEKRLPPFFAPNGYGTQNFLGAEEASDEDSSFNEGCPDVGGLCTDLEPEIAGPELGADCFDDLDNNCNGFADELDPSCTETICNNGLPDGQLDCSLAPSDFTPTDILTGYKDLTCNPLRLTDLDERCPNVGGLCGESIAEPDVPADQLPEGITSGCFDGKNNDCVPGDDRFDGDQGENSDPNCCPDTDGDRFSTFGTLCRPLRADKAPPNGTDDCNDADVAIFPGQTEVCNDARYPLDYPVITLQNEPIDNNCSFANAVHGGADARDRYDPTCCVDLDEDGYGIRDAYFFFDNDVRGANGTVLCGFSGALHRDDVESPDCDDRLVDGANINPGVAEVGPLCSDGIDNNCNELFDHIDFNPDTFDLSCCNVAAMEICNDGPNSDENCNALQGMADNFCMNGDGRTFFDNFTTPAYRLEATTTAQWTDTGAITIAPPDALTQEAFSDLLPVEEIEACANIRSVILTPTEDLPATTDITYQLSIDGGVTWCGETDCAGDVMTGGGTVDFEALGQVGNDLRFHATLFADGINDTVPSLNSLTLTFVCN